MHTFQGPPPVASVWNADETHVLPDWKVMVLPGLFGQLLFCVIAYLTCRLVEPVGKSMSALSATLSQLPADAWAVEKYGLPPGWFTGVQVIGVTPRSAGFTPDCAAVPKERIATKPRGLGCPV